MDSDAATSSAEAVEHSRSVGAYVDGLKEVQVRFLYPFAFGWGMFEEAARTLRDETFVTRRGRRHRLWVCDGSDGRYSEPHHFYKDELLAHVAEFLFPNSKGSSFSSGGCGYFQISDVVANRWFKDSEIQVAAGSMPVEMIAGVRVELFLLPQGTGVLSMALAPRMTNLNFDEVLDFNYRIAQFRRHSLARFRKRHASDDQSTYTLLTPEQRAGVGAAPTDDAPLEDRLGSPGGSFTLAELIWRLLNPLEAFGMYSPISRQEELQVYSVARFGPGTDLADESVRHRLAPFLSALTQVEEPGHSGAAPGDPHVAGGMLNAHHWVAVGLLGAAHLVSDQPPRPSADRMRDVPFNEQKTAVVRDKYFIPYLIALLQRQVLNRAIDEAGRIVALRGEDAVERLSCLRTSLLEFAVGGHFTQVSTRQALHRYYQIARDGLDVPAAWDEIRRAIADIDAQNASLRQAQIGAAMSKNLAVMAEVARNTDEATRKMDENLGVVAHVQAMVEWIEVFLVSVYAAHLWHMFAEAFPPFGHGEAKEWFVSIGVVALAVLAGGLTAFILKPWRLQAAHARGSSPDEAHPTRPGP